MPPVEFQRGAQMPESLGARLWVNMTLNLSEPAVLWINPHYCSRVCFYSPISFADQFIPIAKQQHPDTFCPLVVILGLPQFQREDNCFQQWPLALCLTFPFKCVVKRAAPTPLVLLTFREETVEKVLDISASKFSR